MLNIISQILSIFNKTTKDKTKEQELQHLKVTVFNKTITIVLIIILLVLIASLIFPTFIIPTWWYLQAEKLIDAIITSNS